MPDPEATTSEAVTVGIPFLPWTRKAALKIKVAASLDERWRLRAAVEIAVKDGANLVGANLVGARLDGARLDGARLVGARLVGAHLVGANLDGARLVGANLDGARLVGAHLVGANLDGANLDGARLVGARGIICAGTEPRGYRFLGVRHADQWYVAAGCRWFTIPQAVAHWTQKDNKDALARVGVIQVAARVV